MMTAWPLVERGASSRKRQVTRGRPMEEDPCTRSWQTSVGKNLCVKIFYVLKTECAMNGHLYTPSVTN